MSESFFVLLLIPAILSGFVLIWSGVVWLLAWLSGWQELARHYRYTGTPKGQPIGTFWAMLGPVNHRGTLTMQAAPEGLYLATMVLFRIGHPPLLIPWHAIKRQEGRQLSLIKMVALDLGNPKITTLRLPAAMVDESVLAQYGL
jgi:hypothetical protein